MTRIVKQIRSIYFRNRTGEVMVPTRVAEKTRAPGRPRSEQARQSILKVAYKLLKSQGLNSITTQSIAREAGVSTATLYRWWHTKEEIVFEACFEHLRPALAFHDGGGPLASLRDHVVRGAAWLHSEEARVMARLITGIYGDKKLRNKFLEWYLLPRRQLQRQVIEEAIACGDLRQDTDPDLLIDALYGPLFYRWILGHADPDEEFAGALVDRVLRAFTIPRAV
jgi:AcrR family transcriptional regulator